MSIVRKFCFFAFALAGWLAAGPLLRAQNADTGSGPLHAPMAPAGPAGGAGIRAQVISTNPAPGAGNRAPAAPAAAPSSGGTSVYLLAPQDVVEVRVYQEDDLMTTARIARDGSIKFPLIGSVKIANKTEDAAAQYIGAELAKEYLVNPQVTVKIVEYAQRRYTVLGQVGKPGTYAMPDRESITLFEAIGNAGGFLRIANLGDITLKRVAGGKETTYKLSAKGGTEGDRRASTFEIKPGDIITVGESVF